MIPSVMPEARPRVLLVEDSENDALLATFAFERCGYTVHLDHVWNGEECLTFLQREAAPADCATPDLVLLDLNMPRMDGFEVLRWIKGHDALRSMPVVVLSTSGATADIQLAYALHCNSYVVKPLNYGQFRSAINELARYWFALIALPGCSVEGSEAASARGPDTRNLDA